MLAAMQSYGSLKYGAECSDRIAENMKMIDDFAKEVTIVPIFNSLGVPFVVWECQALSGYAI